MMHSLSMKIVVVEPLPIYAPVRTHHKKRLRKKWLKKYGWKIVGYDHFMGGNIMFDERTRTVYCHPNVMHALRQHLKDVRRLAEHHDLNFVIGKDWGFQ